MCCARCTKKSKCACSVKSIVSDYKGITVVAKYLSANKLLVSISRYVYGSLNPLLIQRTTTTALADNSNVMCELCIPFFRRHCIKNVYKCLIVFDLNRTLHGSIGSVVNNTTLFVATFYHRSINTRHL